MRRWTSMFSLAVMLWLTPLVLWLLAWTGLWQFSIGWSTARPTVIGLWVERDANIRASIVPSAWGDYGAGRSKTIRFPGGFIYLDPLRSGPTVRMISVHLLAVELALAPLPIGTYLYLNRTRVERFRKREGHCLHCGYDLRGSSGRCPECGVEAAASPA